MPAQSSQAIGVDGPLPREIETRRIDQVAHLQHRRRQARPGTWPPSRRASRAHAEVLLEGHLPGHEHQQRGAHAERGGRDRGDAALGAEVKMRCRSSRTKKSRPSTVEVCALEEGSGVGQRSTAASRSDCSCSSGLMASAISA
jgi:hypothetical protein